MFEIVEKNQLWSEFWNERIRVLSRRNEDLKYLLFEIVFRELSETL